MANTPGSPTMLGHLALRVRDVDRAVTFYRDVLGLGLKGRPRPEMAFLGNRADASHELALFQLPADAGGLTRREWGSTTWPGRWHRWPSLSSFTHD